MINSRLDNVVSTAARGTSPHVMTIRRAIINSRERSDLVISNTSNHGCEHSSHCLLGPFFGQLTPLESKSGSEYHEKICFPNIFAMFYTGKRRFLFTSGGFIFYLNKKAEIPSIGQCVC